jgi:hypothetical protein
MAIRIPILTSFDPKGLKSANAAFGNLQGSVRSLGSNFAALGVALAGAGALIAKNVQSLARIETINAQTAQTIKSMGNAANISATEVEGLAGSLESMTAIEAESIQEGANLLLTFGNIRNELGAGNDIFTQTTKIMVDMGVALKKGPLDTATMLGKALNDPIQGMTALRRVGVSFTEQQIEQVKALQNTGDLMGAQKLILEELQKQYGGSGQAFAKTFTGQLELMGHELGTIGEEATMAVMPALQGMIEELRELIPIIGPQLKAAIESVDWKAVVTAVVDFTRFLIENAETIAKTIGVLFALSTIVKTVNVIIGLGKVAVALYTWAMAQLTAGTALATTATNLLSAAMRLLPWVAVATGLFLTIDYFNRTKTAIENTLPALGEFETNSIAAADTASRYTPYLSVMRLIAIETLKATGVLDKFQQSSQNITSRFGTQAEMEARLAARGYVSPTFFPGLPDFQSILDGAGGGGSSLNDELERLNKEAERVAAEAAKAMEQIAADDAFALQQIEDEAQAARDRAAAAEQAVLDKRLNAFESFNDSVKNLFGQIKNSILSSFDLPTLGNSVNSITRNIGKLLERTKSFATNISQLSGMGLNSALLQQVIQAGPMAGSQLASALVGGGSSFIGQLNQAYSEFGGLASGIAGVGTRSAFDNPTIANTYNIEVNGGVGSGPTIGKAIVDAIKSYERTSGAVWQGA